jgi:hypothetical protein
LFFALTPNPRAIAEAYESSDAEKNFVAAWNKVNFERFDIAWKPTGLRAGRLQTRSLEPARPRAGFPANDPRPSS